MKKVLIGGLVLSGLLFGNSCTLNEEKKAEAIFNKSLYESDFNKKIGLIITAKNICGIELVDVELQYLKIEKAFRKSDFKNMKIKLQNLSSANDALDSQHYSYKTKMRKKIDALFAKIGMATESEPLDNEVYKSLIRRKGTYQSDITFYYNSFKIKDKNEAKKIKQAIRYILKKNPKARFSITGHSSSGGNHVYNKKLSQKRANSLEKFIGKQRYIKSFSKGESQLVCKDGLYPNRDSKNEYNCSGGENKVLSRRVIIKRID